MAALALLLTASAAAVLAVLAADAQALTAGLLVTLTLCWVAVGLCRDQLADERRRHAEDRADQARAFRLLYLERSAEHALFASRMRDRLLASDRLARELRGILRLAEARGDEAEHRARAARARAVDAEERVAELEARLAGRGAELIDELAAWDVVPGVDVDTVVDLLSWEEGVARARVVEQRRRA